jgi:MFS family permease
MTGTDAIPDRERLRRNADIRSRRLVWFVVGAAVLVPVVVNTAAFLLNRDGSWSTVEIAVSAIPAAVAVAILLLVLRRRQRVQEPDLLAGADRRTQKAVMAALRSGRTSDARIDALTRVTASRILTQRWLLRVYALVAILQAVLFVLRLIDDDTSTRLALSAALTAVFCALFALQWRQRRLSRRYLDRPPVPGSEARA